MGEPGKQFQPDGRNDSFHGGLQIAHRRAAALGAHVILFALAFLGAFLIRFDFQIPEKERGVALGLLTFVVVVKLIIFPVVGGHFRGWWKYVGLADFIDLAKASVMSSLCLAVLIYAIFGVSAVPRSILVIDLFLTVALVGSVWLSRRALQQILRPMSARTNASPVIIIGATDTGEALLHQIQTDESLPYQVVAFLDEDPKKRGTCIHRVPVLGGSELLPKLAEELGVTEVILANPPASGEQMRHLIEMSRTAGLRLRTLPALDDLLQGRASVRQVRDIKIEDLLRRSPRRLDHSLVADFVHGKSVLVTGAGGSIGSEICRQVARFAPARLVLAERFENALFEIDRELRQLYPRLDIVPTIVDVCDAAAMANLFLANHPDAVFHAAAHKHVPLVERNPGEGVKNNIFGTRVCAEMADEHGAQTFVLISTDKAVRPSSVMGATKRVAELFIQGMAKQSKTHFISVRFGNVLGSNGSVVPIFQEQIRAGGPITVTHPEMQRYFMTIPEASQLVLQAAAMGQGGEVFVLDMGEPVRIVDLARDLIRLSGLRPDIDIPITFTGMRPGEKLTEQLTLDEEQATKTRHEKIWIGRVASLEWEVLTQKLAELRELVDRRGDLFILNKLSELVPEFRHGGTPEGEVISILDTGRFRVRQQARRQQAATSTKP